MAWFPNATGEQIKQAIEESASLGTSPDSELGFGRIQPLEAIRYLDEEFETQVYERFTGQSPPPDITVHVSVGDQVQGNVSCSGASCRWLHVEIEGDIEAALGSGPYTLACAHNGVWQEGFSRGVYDSALMNSTSSTSDCLFGYPGNQVFVVVGAERRGETWYGGYYSTPINWPDCAREPSTCGPVESPTLSVRRGSVRIDDGSCPASAGCRWVIGAGSGWPAGEQFWIRCGSFVDTSRDHPVPYRDRFVDSQGNLTDWREQICYSAGRHTVEVWTESGVRKTVTIPATEPPGPGPTLSVRRGSVRIDDGSCPASAGCRWVIGAGSGWPAGEQFWIRCGSFVDTSRDHPVPYRDRFVDSQGNLTDWREQICYSAGRHTVEVWTESGVRKTVTIPAT